MSLEAWPKWCRRSGSPAGPAASGTGIPTLLTGSYETTRFAFNSGTNLSPFADKDLEFRHGNLPDGGQPPEQRAYVQLGENPRRIPLTAVVRLVLFPGHS